MNAEQRADKDAPEAEPVGELSYMAASRELDGIVEFFERSDVDVDELVTRLERATAIVDELDRRIRRTRAQVEELVPKLEAAGRTASSQDTVAEGDRSEDDRAEEDGAREGEALPF